MNRLTPLEISLSNDEPWLRESKLIDDARLRAARIYNLQGEAPIPAFVSSDGLIACRFLNAMQAIVEPAQLRCCEWGSGIGIVSCLAALRG